MSYYATFEPVWNYCIVVIVRTTNNIIEVAFIRSSQFTINNNIKLQPTVIHTRYNTYDASSAKARYLQSTYRCIIFFRLRASFRGVCTNTVWNICGVLPHY